MKYRGVEQLEARRAHNPEVVGSSPASATKIIPDFGKKSGIFLTFCANLRWRDPVPQLLSPGQCRWQSSYWSFRRMASAAAICSFVGVGTPSSG